MRLDLSLRYLPLPQLSALPLRGPSRKLLEIQSRNEARWAQGKTSKEFQNRKKRLRERLQAAVRPGERLSHERLFEIVRTEVGWHRLLLAIYLDDLGKDWLPAFNKRVAEEVIGESGASWHASRRRQVTQFFFRHFDSIGALASVSKRLRESYAAVSAEPNAAARVWAVHRERVARGRDRDSLHRGQRDGDGGLRRSPFTRGRDGGRARRHAGDRPCGVDACNGHIAACPGDRAAGEGRTVGIERNGGESRRRPDDDRCCCPLPPANRHTSEQWYYLYIFAATH
jgi:hypothetical protein